MGLGSNPGPWTHLSWTGDSSTNLNKPESRQRDRVIQQGSQQESHKESNKKRRKSNKSPQSRCKRCPKSCKDKALPLDAAPPPHPAQRDLASPCGFLARFLRGSCGALAGLLGQFGTVWDSFGTKWDRVGKSKKVEKYNGISFFLLF